MKYKRILIISAVLFLIGVMLFVGAFALSGFDLSKLSNVKYTKKAAEFHDIHNIIIDDENNSVKILRADTDSVQVSYHDSDKAHYVITESGGTLYIKKETTSFFFNFFTLDFSDHTLTLTVPESSIGEISVHTQNGSVTLEGVNAERADVTSSNGGIYISGGNIGVIDTDTSNGPVKLWDMESRKITADTSNAKIVITSVNVPELDASTSNGGIEAYSVRSKKCILETSNGSVDVLMIGDPSEFRISHRTSNGSVDAPPSGSGPRELFVGTSNGNIRIKFEE